MFDDAQKEFDNSVHSMAEISLLKKINKQGLMAVIGIDFLLG